MPLLPTLLATVDELIVTHYVLDTDVVVEGPRKRRCTADPLDAPGLPETARPTLSLGTRVYVETDGVARVIGPIAPPSFERRPMCVVVQRVQRTVSVSGNLQPLWALLRLLDGEHTVSDIRRELADSGEPMLLLARLAAAGIADLCDRPIARFIHSATKKGTLPGRGLDTAEILELVTNGGYRQYPGAARMALPKQTPPALQPFHLLTRTRRSRRRYNGSAISLEDLSALLDTALGVTASIRWNGRSADLRAYPSSGGLYAVEVYPVVFEASGVNSGVYHYLPAEHSLELVSPTLGKTAFVDAALAMERNMVGGVSVMVCLTGVFRRHESKYGEGGYRMVVAEAGHISQNLILAATALGIDARPFGGVFDDMLNQLLCPGTEDEQFLLSVILGYTDERLQGY